MKINTPTLYVRRENIGRTLEKIRRELSALRPHLRDTSDAGHPVMDDRIRTQYRELIKDCEVALADGPKLRVVE